MYLLLLLLEIWLIDLGQALDQMYASCVVMVSEY